jgi:hypothetical protein
MAVRFPAITIKAKESQVSEKIPARPSACIDSLGTAK